MRLVSVSLTIITVLQIGANLACAQSVALPKDRLIPVAGANMRMRSAGLDSRRPGQPVIVLEAGAGAGADHWKPVFSDIAGLAPTVAYDRRGLGQSDVDSVPQSLDRVASSLHALLAAAAVPPPYVLVGASWGGALTRKFASLYPDEVAGLVYLDVTDIDATRAELQALPPGAVNAIFDTPPIPPNVPPGLRAEFESIQGAVKSEFQELRALRPPTSVPSAVVIAGGKTWPGVSEDARVALIKLQVSHQTEWIRPASKGLLLMASKARHFLFTDEPSLVIEAISYVVKNAGGR